MVIGASLEPEISHNTIFNDIRILIQISLGIFYSTIKGSLQFVQKFKFAQLNESFLEVIFM